jgi:hypothetical protein
MIAISSELILEPGDLDRVSIKCGSCGVKVDLSLRAVHPIEPVEAPSKVQEIPTTCPACNDDWEPIIAAVDNFGDALHQLGRFGTTFRISGASIPK